MSKPKYTVSIKTDRTNSTTDVFYYAHFVRSSKNREYYTLDVEGDEELAEIERKLNADDCVVSFSVKNNQVTKVWNVIDTLNEYKLGQTVYPVREEDNGDVTLSVRTSPARTNLSREERLEGWLGCTNGVHQYALGAWEVLAVKTTTLKDGRIKTSLRCKLV